MYDIFGFSRISRFAARRGLCLMQMRVSSWAGTKHRRTHSSHLSARVFSAMFYLLHLWCFSFNRELTSVDLIVFRSVYFFQKTRLVFISVNLRSRSGEIPDCSILDNLPQVLDLYDFSRSRNLKKRSGFSQRASCAAKIPKSALPLRPGSCLDIKQFIRGRLYVPRPPVQVWVRVRIKKLLKDSTIGK